MKPSNIVFNHIPVVGMITLKVRISNFERAKLKEFRFYVIDLERWVLLCGRDFYKAFNLKVNKAKTAIIYEVQPNDRFSIPFSLYEGPDKPPLEISVSFASGS